jgi:hypothetical protein
MWRAALSARRGGVTGSSAPDSSSAGAWIVAGAA